jgi:hypothetical protein
MKMKKLTASEESALRVRLSSIRALIEKRTELESTPFHSLSIVYASRSAQAGVTSKEFVLDEDSRENIRKIVEQYVEKEVETINEKLNELGVRI